MNFFRRHPFTAALLIALAGVLFGTLLGGALGYYQVQKIAEGVRRRNPQDPLDGLPIIFYGTVLVGLVGGVALGLVGAVVFYLADRDRKRVR
ncbi:MAG: hypothetical protein ABR554_11015 [Pyrinomonadaceae bacterium]